MDAAVQLDHEYREESSSSQDMVVKEDILGVRTPSSPQAKAQAQDQAQSRSRNRLYRSSVKRIKFDIIAPLFAIPTSLLHIRPYPHPHRPHSRPSAEAAATVLFPRAERITFTPAAFGSRHSQSSEDLLVSYPLTNELSQSQYFYTPGLYGLPSTDQSVEVYANFLAHLLSPKCLVIHRPGLDEMRNHYRYHEKYDTFFRALCERWSGLCLSCTCREELSGQEGRLEKIEIHGEIRRLAPFIVTADGTNTLKYALHPSLNMLDMGFPPEEQYEPSVLELEPELNKALRMEVEMKRTGRFWLAIRTLAEAIFGFIKPQPSLNNQPRNTDLSQAVRTAQPNEVDVHLPPLSCPPLHKLENQDLVTQVCADALEVKMESEFKANAANMEEMIVGLIQLRMPHETTRLTCQIYKEGVVRKRLNKVWFVPADNDQQDSWQAVKYG
ncbi:hypothetical protein IAT40_006920 [Kwoniella sp. CBS 6097]